jgi:hypothetical protein
MRFKDQFLTAIRTGKSDEELLRIVRDYQGQSSDVREVYSVLEEIWLQLGFDERSDGGTLQGSLEYVMEKIWYECPAAHSTS